MQIDLAHSKDREKPLWLRCSSEREVGEDRARSRRHREQLNQPVAKLTLT